MPPNKKKGHMTSFSVIDFSVRLTGNRQAVSRGHTAVGLGKPLDVRKLPLRASTERHCLRDVISVDLRCAFSTNFTQSS